MDLKMIVRWSLILAFLFLPTLQSQSLFSELQSLASTAESFFEGLSYGLKKVREGLKTFHGVMDAAIDRDCKFSCPDAKKKSHQNLAYAIIDYVTEKLMAFFLKGKVPEKNPRYKPVQDGCGAYGVYLTEKDLPAPEMVKCCNHHDHCYDTCKAKKEKCDEKFEKCLYDACEKHQKKMKGSEYQTCKAGAKLLYLGTLALGCKAYLDSQSRACSCDSGRSEL